MALQLRLIANPIAAATVAFILSAAMTIHASSGATLVDAVDPMIGAVTYPEGEINNCHGFGKTFPGAVTPFGTVQLSPDTITGGDNGSGYSYSHKTIEGFSFLHLSGVGWYGDLGNLQVMPAFAPSRFSHSNETAKAGYYSVMLDDCGVQAELTASEDTGVIRFTYPENAQSVLRFDLSRRIGEKSRAKRFSKQKVTFVSDCEFTGEIKCDHRDGGWGFGAGGVDYTVFFRARVSRPLADRTVTGGDSNLVVTAIFPTKRGERVELEVKISFDSVPEAFSTRGFDAVYAEAYAAWSDTLGKLIEVEGGTPAQRTIFATALYHAFIDPRAIGKTSDGWTRRTVFSGWDVFRSEMPLLTLLRPDVVSDIINSMSLVMKEKGRKTLPRWDLFGCPSGCMIAHPLVSVAADAWEKGIRSFDAETVYAQAAQSLLIEGNDSKLGFSPEGISHTLEYAYNDWCAGRLAEMLGKTDAAKMHYERSKFYTNVWDSSVGWFRSRNKDGSWLEWEGREKHGQGCVESNPWQQGWFVPHDVPGLIRLIGGKSSFTEELESFFAAAPRDFGWNDGYNHPNEPCHFIPFLFAYSDRPELTDKWTRAILDRAYGTGPYGICGNEDEGQMSAWYVLSAIGLHPLCPGDGKWYLTAPIFRKTVIRLDPRYYSGGTFTIRTVGPLDGDVSIKGVTLNGVRLNRRYITTREVASGGELVICIGK